MAFLVEKLRWSLLAGGALLLLLLAGLLGYSRYQAIRAWHRVLERTGATLTRETNGVTWSQSVSGRTVFTIHAAKAVQAKDGKYALHDVSLMLYRQADGRPDRVYGSEFEYDQKTGVARALGEVHMDLQAPGAIRRESTASGRSDRGGSHEPDRATAFPEGEPETIHVKTSGLVYVRNLGVAATDQEVEFRYGALECHARGAEFNSGQSTVHLLGDVQASGQVRGHAVRLTAARADLDRRTNVATLMQPDVHTVDGQASAAGAVLHLRPDGLLTAAEATGSVRLRRGTQVVSASHAELEMNGGSTLRAAKLSGGVTVNDEDGLRPANGRAEMLQAHFGAHGAPEKVIAEGGVLFQAVQEPKGPTGAPGLRREVRGDRMEATFGAAAYGAKPVLQELKIKGQAHLASDTQGPGSTNLRQAGKKAGGKPVNGVVRTQVAADDLLVRLARGKDGHPQPQSAEGVGHTLLEQLLADGSARRSMGDRLDLHFASSGSAAEPGTPRSAAAVPGAGVELTSAMQEGHVALRTSVAAQALDRNGAPAPANQVIEATAQRAEFGAGQQRLVLTGETHVWNGEDDLTATRVELDSGTGDAEATGAVRVTLLQRTSVAAGASGRMKATAAAQATHVAAARAHFEQGSGIAQFTGTDAQPVRLWKEASQLEAASVLLDRQRNALVAKPATPAGLVRVVFVQQPDRRSAAISKARQSAQAPADSVEEKRPGGAKASVEGSGVLRVSSARLDYAGTTHEASFSGGVRASGSIGEVHAQTAVVFLRGAGSAGEGVTEDKTTVAASSFAVSDAFLEGSIDKVVLSGKVQLEQPGRIGTGDHLLYTAATSSFVLTGSPGRQPRVVDAEQGNVSGATLLFRTSDNTVVVAAEPARVGGVRSRVRTELNLHP